MPDDDEIKVLIKALGGHPFKDRSLLELALVHRSAAGERGSNERLEFLGDRVLGLLVAEMLYRRFPAEPEGALARRHAALVRREALARVADKIGLGERLVMSKGEEDAGGRENSALLADGCEALLGALYLDGGLDAARRFISGYWPKMMDETAAPPKDAKTALQEWAQQRGKPLPVYKTLETKGPDHSPVFTVQVSVEGELPVNAEGSSKRIAAQQAAHLLLEVLTKTDPAQGTGAKKGKK